MSKQAERAEWVSEMREILGRAATDRDGNVVVYTILRHVTRSGMSRSITCFVVVDGEPWTLDYRVSKILGWRTDERHGGIRVSGCGMDMGFHLVYSLSRSVYSADESDPGYKLKHRWM